MQCIKNCNSSYWVDRRYQGAKCKTARKETRADSIKHGAGSIQLHFGYDALMAAERVCFPSPPYLAQEQRGLAAVLRVPGFPAATLHSVLANAAQKSDYPSMYCPDSLAKSPINYWL